MSFATLADGTAHRPFVTRALVPRIVGVVDSAIQNSTLKNQFNKLSAFARQKTGLLPRNEEFPNGLMLLYGLSFLASLIVALHFLAKAIQVEYSASTAQAFVYSFAMLAPVSIFSPVVHLYPYDLYSLAFSSLGIYALLKRNWFTYAIVLTLYAIQRENAILLPILFIFLNWKLNVRQAAIWAFVQVFLVLTARVLVGKLFVDNPGVPFEFQLLRLVDLITQNQTSLIAILILVLPYTFFYHTKGLVRNDLWNGAITIYSLGLAAHILVGIILETRTLIDMWPLLAIVAYPLFRNVLENSTDSDHIQSVVSTETQS